MKLSASSVSRVEACPGSWHLENKISWGSRYRAFEGAANFGSAVHDAGEKLLKAFVEGEKLSVIKALKNAGIDKNHADYDRAKHAANEYLKYFKKQAKRISKKGGRVKYSIEDKYRAMVNGVDCVFKCDAMIISEEIGVTYIDIFDLKTGNFDYAEKAGRQMAFSIWVLLYLDKDITNVIYTTHTVQPNFYEESRWFVADKNNYATGEQITDHLMLYIDDLKNNYEYTTGSQCAFCPAVAHCPKMQNIAELSSLFAAANENFTEIEPELLEQFFIMRKPVETFFKAVEQRLNDLILSGSFLNKVYRKKTSGNRRWADKDMVAKTLSHLGDDLYKPKELRTPAQVEKLAGKKNIEDLVIKPERYTLTERADLPSPFDKIGE